MRQEAGCALGGTAAARCAGRRQGKRTTHHDVVPRSSGDVQDASTRREHVGEEAALVGRCREELSGYQIQMASVGGSARLTTAEAFESRMGGLAKTTVAAWRCPRTAVAQRPAQLETEARECLVTGYADGVLGVEAAELGGGTVDLWRCSVGNEVEVEVACEGTLDIESLRCT
jgi:hypothetical protein